ncbi:DUF5107 domain-containing protein [Sphingobacterium phlebotomi]|uniref:DUF5107 domain-containing protein n=1 Tax=Sphingobacterium phlebotomi TaxID=2605433 RepID=A0A5D4HF87_9SPHI|nr:DUF5107 domain-containing protein [Sphingobacterium phlebotomi]TYR38469.1 DUF5107 domain-containing protein [Sphingobacterium phlebotomi]
MKSIKILIFISLFIFNTNAQTVRVTVGRTTIPTYSEPAREDLPMFAENRVHQRSSGNPYPNKIVLQVNREEKVDQEYTLIILENEFLEIQILPELGGKIYAAKDKTNGYDFFYKNHVVKPALIGALGSWTSGGLEFNWPYHHRASSFMPVDYEVEHLANGGVIVWLSEHDPVDRMKGMVGVVLNPGESIFETRVKLSNTTSLRRSFLWWENVAVPANQNYEIFFPHDVSHVYFHYRQSVTTYPIASNATGIFNGISFAGEVDISKHKNTIQPTSFFSAASDFDFFGGYDAGQKRGVVHVADHHVSPGKKMFTWAYNQLSESWENALTDTDGAYLELMAGSYSDNQPDFTWLEPMETKTFSQYWFPIGEVGVPDFANTAGALYCKDAIKLQLNKANEIQIIIKNDDEVLFSEKNSMKARQEYTLSTDMKMQEGYSIEVRDNDGLVLMSYTMKEYDKFNVPHTREGLPNFKEMESPQQLYLAGLHVDQYRDPATQSGSYYEEAIRRDPNFAPALLALGEYKFRHAFYTEALDYLLKAEKVLTQFNIRLEDGKLYYLLGQVYLALEDRSAGYDYLQKAAWSGAYVSPSMTYISLLDIANGAYDEALQHLHTSTVYHQDNGVAKALKIYALHLKGNKEEAAAELVSIEADDKMNHLARFFGVLTGNITQDDFMEKIKTDRNQVCLDLVEFLLTANLKKETITLLEILREKEPICFSLSAIYADLTGTTPDNSATEGIAFPNRQVEMKALTRWADQGNEKAKFQLGCALYAKGHFKDAAALWEDIASPDYRALRNLAVAYYTHLDRREEALPLLQKALSLNPKEEQLIFEAVYVMGKTGVSPNERISFLNNHKSTITRDDIMLEWTRAYTMAGQEDKALELLTSRGFVPAEGGEHAVAEQYMMAYYFKGRRLMTQNKMEDAAVCFNKAQTLPQNLGAGLWNIVKLVPYKYYEGICLKSLGQDAKARENFEFITNIEIDYFSNMHLPELPYYQALCYREMGQNQKGNVLINYTLQDWKEAINKVDPGYFSTTPFFISFCEDSTQQRTAYYSYLLAKAYQYIGNTTLKEMYIRKAIVNDPYALHIFATDQLD